VIHFNKTKIFQKIFPISEHSRDYIFDLGLYTASRRRRLRKTKKVSETSTDIINKSGLGLYSQERARRIKKILPITEDSKDYIFNMGLYSASRRRRRIKRKSPVSETSSDIISKSIKPAKGIPKPKKPEQKRPDKREKIRKNPPSPITEESRDYIFNLGLYTALRRRFKKKRPVDESSIDLINKSGLGLYQQQRPRRIKTPPPVTEQSTDIIFDLGLYTAFRRRRRFKRISPLTELPDQEEREEYEININSLQYQKKIKILFSKYQRKNFLVMILMLFDI
jgi:hypothetical protein